MSMQRLVGLRILLVEDNLLNQEVAKGMLTFLGCDCDVAGHGAEALTMVEDRHYDIVLMDCQSILMQDAEETAAVLERFKEAGVSLAVDDFGTGCSSLSYLKKFPLDALKIDRSFLIDMESARDVSIVHAAIEMASGLGLDVCAEGIENAALLPMLDGMGARYGQGFAIAKPMPSSATAFHS